jgi:hypothetical protein
LEDINDLAAQLRRDDDERAVASAAAARRAQESQATAQHETEAEEYEIRSLAEKFVAYARGRIAPNYRRLFAPSGWVIAEAFGEGSSSRVPGTIVRRSVIATDGRLLTPGIRQEGRPRATEPLRLRRGGWPSSRVGVARTVAPRGVPSASSPSAAR